MCQEHKLKREIGMCFSPVNEGDYVHRCLGTLLRIKNDHVNLGDWNCPGPAVQSYTVRVS